MRDMKKKLIDCLLKKTELSGFFFLKGKGEKPWLQVSNYLGARPIGRAKTITTRTRKRGMK